jgi:MFS family permease
VNNSRPGKIFYGWIVIIVSAVGLFVGYVPIIGFSFGIFFKPLSQEFNWSRAEVSLGFSLSLLVLSAALPIIGRLADKFGARKIILPAACLFGLGLASFYFLRASLWQFYLMYVFLGLVGSGTASVPYYKILAHWFDRRRGLALGLTMGGQGIGFFVMPTLAYALIATVGWRWAYVVIGIAVIAISVPAVGLFLRESPQSMGVLPDGDPVPSDVPVATVDRVGITAREARRSWTFLLMCASLFLVSVALNACLIHLVPLLTDRGISPQSAAFCASLLGGATLVGRVGTGFLLDRFFAINVALFFFIVAGLGILLLWAGFAGPLAFLIAVLLGVGIGAEGDIMPYLVGRYFGLRAFGEIYGYILAAYTLGAVVGPLLMGISFDSTGSYNSVLLPLLVITFAGAVLLTRLGPYRNWTSAPEPVAD